MLAGEEVVQSALNINVFPPSFLESAREQLSICLEIFKSRGAYGVSQCNSHLSTAVEAPGDATNHLSVSARKLNDLGGHRVLRTQDTRAASLIFSMARAQEGLRIFIV